MTGISPEEYGIAVQVLERMTGNVEAAGEGVTGAELS
jgi:hypothetical protein